MSDIILTRDQKTGLAYPTLENIVTVFQQDPYWTERFWYDTFSDRILIANSPVRELRKEDIADARVYLQQRYDLRRASRADTKEALEFAAWRRHKHAVLDYLATVTWDDEPRVDRWLIDYMGAAVGESQPLDYLLAAGRNCLLSLMARVLWPGCQVDTMLVLEGEQGTGKTSALRILGGPFYRVALYSMDRTDFLQALRGTWLMEVAELSATTKADVERVKVIVSTPSDPYRASYGEFVLNYPRQCIFVGTTNRDDYLQDETGGRRFHPVRCGVIDLASLTRDREQLLAEAYTRAKAGEPWHQMPTATTLAVQADRVTVDPWTDAITDYIQGKTQITLRSVALDGLKLDQSKLSERESKRIGRIMRLLGWRRGSIRENGKVKQGYVPKEEPNDQ